MLFNAPTSLAIDVLYYYRVLHDINSEELKVNKHNGEVMAHWTEELFRGEQAKAYLVNLENAIDRASNEVDTFLSLLETEHDVTPTTALDIGCGIGRHSIELAEQGVSVSGIDISPEYLDRARERAKEREVEQNVEFHRHDMRELEAFQGEYELTMCYYNTFGYYDDETNRSILRAMKERTAEDGALLLQALNREALPPSSNSSTVHESDDSRYLYSEKRSYTPETGRATFCTHMFERIDGKYVHKSDFEFEERLYSPVELRNRVLDAGFSTVEMYEDIEGADMKKESRLINLVAEK